MGVMLKEVLILLFGASALLCAVRCERQPDYQKPDPFFHTNFNWDAAGPAPEREPLRQKVTGHLKELLDTTSKGTVRVYQDAKPALNNLKSDLKETVHAIKSNPNIKKGVERVNSHYGAVKERAAPIISSGNKKLTGFWAKVSGKNKSAPAQSASSIETRAPPQYDELYTIREEEDEEEEDEDEEGHQKH